jgi:hypothetical protein
MLPTTVGAVIFDWDGQRLPDTECFSDQVAWTAIESGNDQIFNGVVHFANNCSGALFAASKDDSSPVYLLTNGHCIAGSDSFSVTENMPLSTTVTLENFIDVLPEQRLSLTTSEILFSTQNRLDLAVVDLQQTVGQMKNRGIDIYRLAPVRPLEDEEVTMVGILNDQVNIGTGHISDPSVSYPQLRMSSCRLGKSRRVEEGLTAGLMPWETDSENRIWPAAIQHNCSGITGFSGSPIFNARGQIVAILNTGVTDATSNQPACSSNRPCEIDDQGLPQVNDQVNYAIRVEDLLGCFDLQGVFDIERETCRLPRNFSNRRHAPLRQVAIQERRSVIDLLLASVSNSTIMDTSSIIYQTNLLIGDTPYESSEAYMIEVEFPSLTKEQFDFLKMNYGQNRSQVQYKQGNTYRLRDFLPPFMQVLLGHQFLPEIKEYNPEQGQWRLLFTNCYSTAAAFAYDFSNRHDRVVFFNTDMASAGLFFNNPDYFEEVFDPDRRPSSLHNNQARFGDIVIRKFSYQPDGIDHVMIFVDNGLFFEKTDASSSSSYRLVDLSTDSQDDRYEYVFLRIKNNSIPHPDQLFENTAVFHTTNKTLRFEDSTSVGTNFQDVEIGFDTDGLANVSLGQSTFPVWGDFLFNDIENQAVGTNIYPPEPIRITFSCQPKDQTSDVRDFSAVAQLDGPSTLTVVKQDGSQIELNDVVFRHNYYGDLYYLYGDCEDGTCRVQYTAGGVEPDLIHWLILDENSHSQRIRLDCSLDKEYPEVDADDDKEDSAEHDQSGTSGGCSTSPSAGGNHLGLYLLGFGLFLLLRMREYM